MRAAQAYGVQAANAPASDLPAPAEGADANASAAPAVKDAEDGQEVTMSSDKNVEDEIQKLKAKKQQIQAQLAEAASPDEKAAIQQQLRQLDAQIKSREALIK